MKKSILAIYSYLGRWNYKRSVPTKSLQKNIPSIGIISNRWTFTQLHFKVKTMKILFLILIVATAVGCNSIDHGENISIVEKYVKSVENLDYMNMESLLADNYKGYGPSAGDSIGKIAAIENWKNNVNNLYKKIEYTRSQFAGITIEGGPNKGDWVANWAELTIEYKDGKGPVKIWANSIYTIENGKIVKSITFYNEADVLRQLGYEFINPNGLLNN